MAENNDLAAALARVVRADLPLSAKERREQSGFVPIVLNPGSFLGIMQERFGPGSVIYVDPHQAKRLTAPNAHRIHPTARYLDDPEPNARGQFPQVAGAGRYHPESKHHQDPQAEPVEPAQGQEVTAEGRLVEPVPSDTPSPSASDDPGAGDPADAADTPSATQGQKGAGPRGTTPPKKNGPRGQPTPIGDGGKAPS